MSELTQEQYDELPDFAKDAFAKDGEVYIPAKDAKLKSTLDELDKKYKEADSGYKSVQQQLEEYKAKEAERAKELESQAFEKLKKEGKIDEILKDQERRHGESIKEYEQRIEKMQSSISKKARESIASRLASEYGTDKGKKLLEKAIMDRIQYDPEEDKYTFLTEDGSATSLDLEGFTEELIKSDFLSPLLKAEVSSGGAGEGGLNQGGGAGSKKVADMTSKEKSEYISKHGLSAWNKLLNSK
jgi:hypothetical protein